MSASTGFRVKGRHVLIAMLAFFGVVIGVNVYFIYKATSTYPGVEVHRSYTQGRTFNHTLAERAVQAERGWNAGISLERLGADDARVEILILDEEGDGVSGLALEGHARRPATDADARALAFAELDEGLYQALIEDLPGGAWRVSVDAAFPDGAPFRASREIMIE